MADPFIINMIWQTCIRIACKYILEINDVVCKFNTGPLNVINSIPLMMGKWLLDTGVRLTCIFTQQFRQIPKEKRLTKLTLNQREARGVSGTALIPDGDYLFPMEWNKKMVMQPEAVFKKFSSPLMLVIDTIDILGISYLSRTKSFVFEKAVSLEEFQKADLRFISTLKIPAHAGVPVRLGTTIDNSQNTMSSGLMAVTTTASLDFPCLIAQPGLVSPDHQH
jgi:hypothetical protein